MSKGKGFLMDISHEAPLEKCLDPSACYSEPTHDQDQRVVLASHETMTMGGGASHATMTMGGEKSDASTPDHLCGDIEWEEEEEEGALAARDGAPDPANTRLVTGEGGADLKGYMWKRFNARRRIRTSQYHERKLSVPTVGSVPTILPAKGRTLERLCTPEGRAMTFDIYLKGTTSQADGSYTTTPSQSSSDVHTSAPLSPAQPSSAPPSPAQPSNTTPTTTQPSNAPPSPAQPSNVPPTLAQPCNAPPTTTQPSSAPPSPAQPCNAPPSPTQPSSAPPALAQPSNAPPTTTQPSSAPPSPAQPSNVPPSPAQLSIAPPTLAQLS